MFGISCLRHGETYRPVRPRDSSRFATSCPRIRQKKEERKKQRNKQAEKYMKTNRQRREQRSKHTNKHF